MNALATIHPTVVSRIWLQQGGDPPELEVRLSTGAYLLVRWDPDYQHPVVLRAANGVADFESIPSRESGLSDDVLGELVEEVKRAVEADEAERLSDQVEDHYGEGR